MSLYGKYLCFYGKGRNGLLQGIKSMNNGGEGEGLVWNLA